MSKLKLTIPPAPSDLKATFELNPLPVVNLSWVDNSKNEAGFKIERSIDKTSFTQIAKVNQIGTNISARTLYYRVQAFNSAGAFDYSNITSVTIPSIITP